MTVRLVFLMAYLQIADPASLQTSLTEILLENPFSTIMKNERTPCRSKFIGNLEPEFTNILIKQMSKYISLETQFTGKIVQVQVYNIIGSPLHSSFCVNIVVLTTNSIEVFLESVMKESSNRRLEMLHFIFLEDQSFLQRIWHEKPIKRLKFKTGIITDSNGLILTQRETAIADSQIPLIQIHLPQSCRKWNSIRNQHLSIAIFKLLTYVLLNSENKPIMGMTYNFIQAVSKFYNVSMSIDISLTKFGKSKNGSWEGFIGEVVTGRKDIIAGIGGLPARFEALDFTSPIFFGSMRAFLSHPKTSVKWQAILLPFDTTVWLIVFIFFVLSVTLFYIHLNLKRSNDTELPDKIYLSIMIPFSALIQASRGIPHRARFFTVITLFYALVVGQFYCSNLISFLTFPEPEVIPRSFEDLSNRNDYTIHMMSLGGLSTDVFFNQTKIKTFVKIRERMIKQKDFFKCAEFAVLSPKTACIGYPEILVPIIANNFTLHSGFNPLRTTPHCLSFPINVALQKNSKHFESVNSIVGWACDTGHFTKWWQMTLDYLKNAGSQWLKHRRDGKTFQKLHELLDESQHQDMKPFGVKHFVLCFCSVLVGGFLASIIWICEILSSHVKDRPLKMPLSGF
ncbi:unnamed protein product [Allacma fusca]|uniref:Ionotropic glutamate receptor C-terminal domain-containing protein n=1 Tax=Allacma fusca TaxID=39272 RepID=A0A8J2L5D1_9HEXA|nr:unnamed protein product [Allacma fusca]